MKEYKDPITGYTVRRFTEGPERNSKLYFTCENYSTDDKYFFFNKENTGVCRANVETGEIEVVADTEYNGFATDREKNVGYLCKNNTQVYKMDLETTEKTFLGNLPKDGRITGHLTAANTGRVACSYHLANKIYALVVLDPGKEEADVVYRSDYRLGHAQICPTDENMIFYIHETEGDAFQRTWMCDVKEGYVRPYYVEHPNEWITHEVWTADGSEMAIMKLRAHVNVEGVDGTDFYVSAEDNEKDSEKLVAQVLIGDKDGRSFDVAAEYHQLLHPCLSRDKKWICADVIDYLGGEVQTGIVLVERATKKLKFIASCGICKTGADHQHPSFNRAGTQILFSNPDENGIAQVCTIDLDQIKKDW